VLGVVVKRMAMTTWGVPGRVKTNAAARWRNDGQTEEPDVVPRDARKRWGQPAIVERFWGLRGQKLALLMGKYGVEMTGMARSRRAFLSGPRPRGRSGERKEGSRLSVE